MEYISKISRAYGIKELSKIPFKFQNEETYKESFRAMLYSRDNIQDM